MNRLPSNPAEWVQEFDAWRERYDTMSFADQQSYSALLGRIFPNQSHYDPMPLIGYLGRNTQITRVIEMGGWDGSLASICLDLYPRLTRWINYDIWDAVLTESVTKDPRYEPTVLHDWLWKTPAIAEHDLFVATHTIEHIKAEELRALVEHLKSPVFYFEAPLPDNRRIDNSWKGYYGTHIQSLGWRAVHELMESLGYHHVALTGMAHAYERTASVE